MNIVYVTADTKEEWNCAEWRCAVPSRAINRLRNHSAELIDWVAFANNTQEAQRSCQNADIIVVQRNLFGPVLAAIQHWKARDKILIADFDDAYPLIPPNVKNYSFWVEGKFFRQDPIRGLIQEVMDPPPLTQFKWGVRLVHGLTVPSTRLAEDWKAYQSAYLVPNYIEVERYLLSTQPKHDDIILGWGGSLSHLQSFTDSGVIQALEEVCAARSQVKVMICGDQRVYDLLPIPEKQKIFQPWVSIDRWPYMLRSFDIGLAPLAGPYDERRSWIKVMEYMLMKIPWVASDNSAYNELRPYGWLVQNTSGAWSRVIQDMIDHLEEYRKEAAGEPYLFALSQNIEENIDKVLAVYATIASNALGEPFPIQSKNPTQEEEDPK